MNREARSFVAARATAVGTRQSNQDRCFFFDDGNTLLLGIADGLGGHPRGDVAAQLLADVCESVFRQSPRPLVDPTGFMLDCIARTHAAICRFGGRQSPPISPRTTAVLVIVQDGIAHWAHVGDSRLYLFRAGHLIAQTTDHAQVQYIRYSADAPPRARTSLTRCLGGMPQPPTTTCSAPFPLDAGDSLLLCTDGLWGQLPDERLIGLFEPPGDHLEPRLMALVEEAARHPISDNVTALALTWVEPTGRGDDAQPPADAPRDIEPPFAFDQISNED